MKYSLKIQFILFILFNSFCIGELIRPYQGQELNYIHVLFEWEQNPDVNHYQIELIELSSNSTFIIDSLSTNLFIDRSNISWNKVYQWRVRSLLQSNEYGDWTEPAIFITKESKLHYVNITNYQDSLIQDGLTMVGGPNPIRHTVVIDRYGNEIWNDGEFSFKINHVDDYGAIYGNSDHLYPDYSASKINYDMDFLWRSDQEVDPHELKETSRNTFFTLKNIFSNGPIPSDVSMVDQFRDLGFLADDTTNEFPWYGQEIIEFDQDNNIIWSWDPFEHFSLDDHDRHGHTWEQAYMSMKYDWTHSNSIYFDEEESAIYLSSRHLSRITKIDYPSGNVIYNIGLPSDYIDSGDSCIGNELLFNFQHHIEKLPNGNFTLFDNGNISNYLFDHGLRISRAIEFEVVGDTVSNMIWSYSLPNTLFGRAGGSMQVLENNNRLIYTRGNSFGAANNPTIIEVTNELEVVWKLRAPSYYAWYRAFRIPSIHPDAFSVLVDPFTSITMDETTFDGIILKDENTIKVSIKNESDYDQPYFYKIKDDRMWVDTFTGTAIINAGETLELRLDILSNGQTRKNPFTDIDITVIPTKHSYAKKHLKFRCYDRSYTRMAENDIDTMINGHDNSPNPFNPVTNIRYELLQKTKVNIVIFDINGRKVKDLLKREQEAGIKSVKWNATDNNGRQVSAGLYFYTLEAGSITTNGKMLLLK